MVNALQEDLQAAAVVDVVLRSGAAGNVVLTLDRRYIEPSDLQLLRGSTVTVLGKVTGVLDRSVSLLRRSAFGLGGEDVSDTTFGDFRNSLGAFARDLPDPTIQPPAVQVLPLAVFV